MSPLEVSVCHSATSSPSSADVESHHGTPGTKLTDFSPEDFRGEPKTLTANSIQVNLPPTFALQGVPIKLSPNGKARVATLAVQDPFTSIPIPSTAPDPSSVAAPKLSPTAATFMPLQPNPTLSVANRPQVSSFGVFDSNFAGQHSGVAYLNATSIPDPTPSNRTASQNLISCQSAVILPPIGPPPPGIAANPSLSGECGPQGSYFATADGSRYFKISHVPTQTSPHQLNAIFSSLSFSVPKLIVITDLNNHGIIYVKYSDLRDARQAYSGLHCCQPQWRVEFIRVKDFVINYKPQELARTSSFDGQILVTASYTGVRQTFDVATIVRLLKDILEHFGDLIACVVGLAAFPTVSVSAEFYDCSAAEKAVTQLDGFQLAAVYITVEHYAPDLFTGNRVISPRGPLIIGQVEDDFDESLCRLDLGGVGANPASLQRDMLLEKEYTSSSLSVNRNNGHNTGQQGYQLYAATTTPTPDNIRCEFEATANQYRVASFGIPNFGMPLLHWPQYRPDLPHQGRAVMPYVRARVTHQPRSLQKQITRQTNDYASGHHNVVDVERIRQGLDVRTTIMLRNIPNKIDQSMLKEIVDETSHGRYDFMYLRIDFANNCNVGYAFINFEDPWYIIDFVQARAGHRWNRFNSDKVAEVSYATIQGKDCLVQKFRNSSVMLEHPSFRPKIFHTGSNELSGKEDSFPGPDNPSKMRRSVENAEHVGLFAPRAGQHFRDEQRRRRSQYDRGTRLAEIEDAYDYDDFGCRSPFHQKQNATSTQSHQNFAASHPYRF